METFLYFYSQVKSDIIEEQDGLERTVFKSGKGVEDAESEVETDEGTVEDDDDGAE